MIGVVEEHEEEVGEGMRRYRKRVGECFRKAGLRAWGWAGHVDARVITFLSKHRFHDPWEGER